jgi:hypothetical protein
MATFTTTTKYALRWLTGTNLISDIDAGFQTLAEDIDASMAGYASGTVAALPAAGKAGRIYRATDAARWFVDTGTAWDEIARLGTALGSWRTVSEGALIVTNSDGAGSFYPESTTGIAAKVGQASSSFVPNIFQIGTDYDVPGLTTKFRLKSLLTSSGNAAPAVQFTMSLASVGTIMSSVASGMGISTVSTIAASLIVRNTPPLGTTIYDASSEFTLAGSNFYVLLLTCPAVASGAAVSSMMQLQVRNA